MYSSSSPAEVAKAPLASSGRLTSSHMFLQGGAQSRFLPGRLAAKYLEYL